MALAAAGYFWGSDLWKAAPDGAAPGGAARPPAAIVIAPAPDASMPQFVDLADIIGGGNGFGSGRKGVGIDPSTGMLSRDVGQEMQGPVNRFQRTASPLVDGVFIPNGNVKGSRIPVQVSSSGIQVADLPSTSGHWQGFPRNGADADSQSVLNFIDYQSAGHSVLGLHANLGITFDLSAIRKLLPERKLAMFTAWLGNSSIGSTEFRVYLDGKCQAICSEITNSSRATRVQVPLASARFLTLISLDAGTFGHDATFLGDPRLMLDRVSAADKKK
jgi:hypothetical protein